MKVSKEARLRLWAIYQELGYIPWRKPRKERKRRSRGVYIGALEAIPFMNDDAKRTLSHLLFRPGYMMRDYILRGQHERYLAPLTALLVFYSFFTLLVAVFQPSMTRSTAGDELMKGMNVSFDVDSTGKVVENELLFKTILETAQEAVDLTQLDIKPEAVDTPWKASLAALEGDLRSKGVHMFLGSFILLWITMLVLLRKYGVSVSGAAAASAYVLCQFCIFMFLALLLSWGKSSELGLLLMAALLFIDYRQMLGIRTKEAFWLTVKSGLFWVLIWVNLVLLLAGILFVLAVFKVG